MTTFIYVVFICVLCVCAFFIGRVEKIEAQRRDK